MAGRSKHYEQLFGGEPRDRTNPPPEKRPARARPRLPKISEETRRLAALLESEALSWPDVSSRPMFGLNGLYRGRQIFAVLPRTRAMDAPESISFRLTKRRDRIASRMRNDDRIIMPSPDTKWISFIIESDAAIHDALKWLELAYREAGKN